MKQNFERPAMKDTSAKIAESEMQYFELGIDMSDFELPSKRKDYHSDERAVALVEAVKAGKDLSGMDFTGINLKGADISGGKFQNAKFSKAVFYETKAVGCDFTGADFSEGFIENSDFSDSTLTDTDFRLTFAHNIALNHAILEEKLRAKLTALDYLIHLIETGQIDLRSLCASDLLHLDLRRIDLSKVDLTDIDLSSFDLEGVNLGGTYVNPNQLTSLECLYHYHANIQAMDEKRVKAETLKVMQAKMQELTVYAAREKENADKRAYTKRKKLKRPPIKHGAKKGTQVVQQTAPQQPADTAYVHTESERTKILSTPKQIKKTNLKNRN